MCVPCSLIPSLLAKPVLLSVIEQIFSRAKAFADNSGRARPAAPDILAAALEYDLDVTELAKENEESKKRSQKRRLEGRE